MKKFKKLIIACDGESASGKSTAAKQIAKKYNLLLINSGLLYRYGSKIIIKYKPKNIYSFLENNFRKTSYNKISKQRLHTEQISNHVADLAKDKKVRKIINIFQKRIIKKNKMICVEGRDIASKILAKNPKYDLAFYFKCKLNIASYRRWIDLKKRIPLKEVQRSLKKEQNLTRQEKIAHL